MTISSVQNRVTYEGNGVTVVFAVPFRFLQQSDLVVLLRNDTSLVETTKVLDTDYEIAGDGDAGGGTVTFLIKFEEPATGETVVIYNDPPLTQTVDYRSGDAFPAETHEQALDLVTLQQKRTREITTRALLLPDSHTDGSGAFDANGNKISDLGTPTLVGDATTKTYVDALVNNTALGPAPTGLIATGSDTSRTLAARWGEVKNIRDYGALGDGTTNDSAAIQAAIDALPAAGGTVLVPASANPYGISSTINMKPRVSLVGHGTGTKIKALAGWTATNPLVKYPTTGEEIIHQSWIRDIGLHCNALANVGVYAENWQEPGGMDNVVISGAKTYGLHFYGQPGGDEWDQIAHCYFSNVWIIPKGTLEFGGSPTAYLNGSSRGIYLNDTTGNMGFDNVTISGDATNPLDKCIEVDSPSGIVSFRRVHGEQASSVILCRAGDVESDLVTGHSTITTATDTFVNANVNAGTNRITLTSHPFVDNYGPIRLTTTDVLPGGLDSIAEYWVDYVDANTVSLLDGFGGSVIDITGTSGSGTHTISKTVAIVEITPQNQTFIPGNVTAGTDQVAITAHPYPNTYGPVQLTTTAADLPSGLAVLTDYWISSINANAIKFLDVNGAIIDLVDGGTGTHTISPRPLTGSFSGIQIFPVGSTGSAFKDQSRSPEYTTGTSSYRNGNRIDHYFTSDADDGHIVTMLPGSTKNAGRYENSDGTRVVKLDPVGQSVSLAGTVPKVKAIRTTSGSEVQTVTGSYLSGSIPTGFIEADDTAAFEDATCDLNSNTTVTMDSTANVVVGQLVTGDHIPDGTSVASKAGSPFTTLTLSQAATATKTNVALNFGGRELRINPIYGGTTKSGGNLYPLTALVTLICTTATSTTVELNAGSTTSIFQGQRVTGLGIPAGATVASITDADTFVLSIAATSSLNPVTLAFLGREEIKLGSSTEEWSHLFVRAIVQGVTTFTSGDGTPSVSGAGLCLTAGTTAITDFDDGVLGQTITIKAKASITITDNAAIIQLGGSGDYNMGASDTLTLTMFDTDIWTEVARSNN